MLNRRKLPKQPILTHYPGMTLKTEAFYEPKDLIVGQYVNIHGKEAFIYDVDDFTRDWYRVNLGLEQQAAELPA